MTYASARKGTVLAAFAIALFASAFALMTALPGHAFAVTHAQENAAAVMGGAGSATDSSSPAATDSSSSSSSSSSSTATPKLRLFAKAASTTTTTSATPTSGITLSMAHTHRNSDLKSAALKHVIDVSEFNTCSFKKIKAAGVDGIIIRCGYQGYGSGGLYEDSTFLKNYVAAKKAGLKVGVYFYTEAITTTEAKQQATFVSQLISEAKAKAAADSTFKSMMAKDSSLTTSPDYYVAFDYESASGGRLEKANISQSTGAKIAKTFLAAIKTAGYEPILYTGADFSAHHVNATTVKNAGYDIWFAHYSAAAMSYKVDGWYDGRISLWQAEDSAKVNGITSGVVDFDYAYDPTTVSLSTANDATAVAVGSERDVTAKSTTKHFGTLSEKYTWTSSDTSIATVNSSGSVTGVSEGTVTITATGKTSGASQSITLNVKTALETLSAPGKPAVTVKTDGKYATLSWKATKNAEWYTVVDSSNNVLKKTTGTSVKLTVGYGKTAAYRVIAYRTSDYGNVPSTAGSATVKTKPANLSGLKAKKVTKSSVKLTWSKASGATTYRVYRSSNGGKSYKRLIITKSTSYTNTKVTKGKKYLYRVRAYASNGLGSKAAAPITVTVPRA
ncbi:MAG: GH25 family lysozyme [Eggerthellaceae bacterium]|jgi:hypothetical protein